MPITTKNRFSNFNRCYLVDDAMETKSNPAESRGILLSTIGNLVIGLVGLIFALFSHSQAILLDGLFNLTYVGTGLFTLKVARLVQLGDDEWFPMGYAFFEPLINGIKGMLVLGVSVMALIGAMEALFAGGRAISPGLATLYGVFAAGACWILAYITHRGAKRTGSPLLKADAENWLVNGAISSAVLLAFLGIFIIRDTQFAAIVPYVDPVLVLVVVLISISVPVRMAWQSLMELLNRAPSAEIVREVEEVVGLCTGDLPVKELFVRVIQPGRTRMILAHVILPSDYSIDSLPMLDAIRTETLIELKKIHQSTAVDLVFTADRTWGAPSPLGT